MSIYKRGKVWWIRFTTPNGQRISTSAKTADRQAAQEYHDRLKAEYWRIQKLGERPSCFWEQAVVRWLNEHKHKKTLHDDRGHFRWLDNHLRGRLLSDITRDHIESIIQAKLSEGVSNARVNRMLALIRAILRRAANHWDWLEKVPTIQLLPEPKRRVRWLTPQQAEALIAELPPHLAAIVKFALATGLRDTNITGLEWSQVDLDRKTAWIHPDQSKTGRPIPVSLNEDAIRVLHDEVGKHLCWVFTYRGDRITRANNRAWRKALLRVGIEDFRFHDLRHTWATWHVQRGTPLHILQEMGGWSSYEMVRRYAHLGADHLAAYSGNSLVCFGKSDT